MDDKKFKTIHLDLRYNMEFQILTASIKEKRLIRIIKSKLKQKKNV